MNERSNTDTQPQPTKSAKLIGTVVKTIISLSLLFMLAPGLFIGSILLDDIREAVHMRLRWQATTCRITASDVTRGWDEKYIFQVEYACQIGTEEYVFDTYRKDYYGSTDFSEAQMLANRYAVGSEAICYVSPDKPYRAVIEHSSLWAVLFALLPLSFIAMAIGAFYFLWWGERSFKKQAPSSTQKARPDMWIALIASGFFCATGLIFLFHFLLVPVSQVLDATDWEKTPCNILSSRVHIETDCDDTSYSVDILYHYTVQNKEYRSNQYSFFGNSPGSKRYQERIVNRYPEGSVAICYVDPDDPRTAVLDRGFTVDILPGLMPLVFVVLGGLLFAGLLTSMLRPTSHDGEGTVGTRAAPGR